jgi:hypothetical protein
VAVSGSTIVIGTEFGDDQGFSSGSAYVFEDRGSGWIRVAKLLPAEGRAHDLFGEWVAVNGSAILIGAPANGIGGSAYVFENGITGWTQVAQVLADDGSAGDCFGRSTAVSGGTIIVGARDDDPLGDTSASAYIFEPIPEPATLGLFGLVGVATAWSARRRRPAR